MRTKLKKDSVLFLRKIHPEVKRMFRSIVVRRGDTMSLVVEALMRGYIENPSLADKELISTKIARRRN